MLRTDFDFAAVQVAASSALLDEASAKQLRRELLAKTEVAFE